MTYLLALIGGYLVGSIPTAYLLVKKTSGVDIRDAGSGNVGGYNAFTVTRSKITSGLVIFLDGAKGFVAVLLGGLLAGSDPWFQGVTFLAAILGHNYPVWLRFRGGRGLATAAGGFFALGISFTLVWCLLWNVAYRISGDILKGNIIATVATPFLLWMTPWLVQALLIANISPTFYLQCSSFLSLLLLVSHLKPILRWLRGEQLV